MAPVGYGGLRGPAGPPPRQVELAVRLMFANIALQLISLIASFALRNQIIDKMASRSSTALSTAQLRSAANAGYGVGIGISIIFMVLYILLALQVRKGKNWARITTIVFASLGLLSLFNVVSPTAIGLLKLIGLVAFAINLAILLLLARQPAAGWFKPRPVGY
jgi:hypothetical protein